MERPSQYVPISELGIAVNRFRLVEKKRIVLTTGVFDLLHAGHVGLISRAKEKDDEVLFVGVNSDERARQLKGRGHPIITEALRVVMVAALRWVDVVTTFDGPTPEVLLHRIRPDVYVKGDDYRDKVLPELQELDFSPTLRILSSHPIRTTSIIARAKSAK